ncbi:MAG TPA: hypothetical protein VF152_07480 [Acidimicrobiia bacterium]
MNLADDATGRARYYRACAIGALAAGIVFMWMLAAGRVDLGRANELSHFYDSQAHSLLDGHWDVPRDDLGIEAWIVDGKAYMYFGPVPALMRMPVALFTDRFDGHLTQLSMLAAFAVLMVFTTRLGWRIRTLARGHAPESTVDAFAAGAFTFVVGTGSVVLFLASRPIVYHEAELWGAALAIAAFDFLLVFVLESGARPLAWAAVFGGAAFLTRASVGAGPLAALGLLLLARLLLLAHRRFRHRLLVAPLGWLGLGDDNRNRGYLLPLTLAVAIPAALYMYVNYARFRHPWSLPISRHATVLQGIDPDRIEALAANGNSQFGLKFVPTNVLAMLRPDGLGVDGLFPWLTFPPPADVIGNVKFDTIDWAGSIPATMPLLFVLALVGAVAVFRRRTASEPSVAALRVPVLGAFAGGFVTLTIYFIAQRYISDFLPLIVILGLVGLHVLLQRLTGVDPRRGLSRALVTGFVVLALFSVWANFSLALLYQREFNVFLSPSERADFVGFQYRIDELFPGGSRFDLGEGPTLPRPEPALADTLFAVGDCDGLYWTDGEIWFGVERTAVTGEYPLRVTFPDAPRGTTETLLTVGSGDERDRVLVEYRDDDHVVFAFETSAEDGRVYRSDPVEIDPGREYLVDVVVDSVVGRFDLEVDGDPVFGFTTPVSAGPVVVAGTEGAGEAVDFGGTVEHVPATASLCRDLVAAR